MNIALYKPEALSLWKKVQPSTPFKKQALKIKRYKRSIQSITWVINKLSLWLKDLLSGHYCIKERVSKVYWMNITKLAHIVIHNAHYPREGRALLLQVGKKKEETIVLRKTNSQVKQIHMTLFQMLTIFTIKHHQEVHFYFLDLRVRWFAKFKVLIPKSKLTIANPVHEEPLNLPLKPHLPTPSNTSIQALTVSHQSKWILLTNLVYTTVRHLLSFCNTDSLTNQLKLSLEPNHVCTNVWFQTINLSLTVKANCIYLLQTTPIYQHRPIGNLLVSHIATLKPPISMQQIIRNSNLKPNPYSSNRESLEKNLTSLLTCMPMKKTRLIISINNHRSSQTLTSKVYIVNSSCNKRAKCQS